MTCIAGVRTNDGRVYIGGDSAGVGDYDLSVRADSKVFVNGAFLFGFTSSFRMGQVLRYAFIPPQRDADTDVMAFMVKDFVNGVRQAFKDAGVAQKNNEVESCGVFLVGYAGRLFNVGSDYQVGEAACGYDAVGCGGNVAQGALFVNRCGDPRDRITEALMAAEAHSAGVRGPFVVLGIGDN